MKPRLPTSKKWTSFPKEYISQIEQVFSQAFAAQLTTGKLIVEGQIYPEEITLRVGYLEQGRLSQANFEISMNYSKEKQDAVDRIHNCIDAAASMMNEYFESEGDVDFPLAWKEYDFSGVPIFVQYSTVNSELENKADELLGVSPESLVVEADDTEDALSKASERLTEEDQEEEEVFFQDEEEEEEHLPTDKPQIFSGRKKKKKEDLH
jgi:hypothetical protein